VKIDSHADRADRPCRRCQHYDCKIDRGEALPEGVTAYVNGKLYRPAAARPANAANPNNPANPGDQTVP
jgi:hypothetical protein